ncbi:N-acetylglucosamine kinase [Paenibacillus daejeonensis]|uniref:N-acetylglucosamine kinase n=1 Tax=Paenibacillus daejeonensis TaxID=135193 RepID=UPI00036AF850|nr:BadF/BadG/BcrA/BcrD ATPase family protein [Paenibacillus daejeonensis]
MTQNQEVVIGIDGGGTHTRVMVANLEGQVLSYVEKGASSIYKDAQASQNVRQAIEEALQQAGVDKAQVRMLTAGIAGFDAESDLEWVLPLTDVEGLDCTKVHVNDAVVAHSGALMAEPGIIVISGTGSILYAVNEEGRRIRNYDLHHYAASAARFLAYDATYELLAGSVEDRDNALIQEMLAFWDVSTVKELSHLALQGFIADQRERNKRFAELAPLITQSATSGSPLAQRVCDRALHQIAIGVEMLASYFERPKVQVSLIGSVVTSDYFRERLASRLAQGVQRSYQLVEPVYPPVIGAVLLAFKELHIPISEEHLEKLSNWR